MKRSVLLLIFAVVLVRFAYVSLTPESSFTTSIALQSFSPEIEEREREDLSNVTENAQESYSIHDKVGQEEHQSPYLNTTLTFASNFETDRKQLPYDEVVKVLQLRSSNQQDANVIFLTSVKQYDQARLKNPGAFIGWLRSPCIQGTPFEQRICWEEFARSRLCSLSHYDIVPPYYAMNDVSACMAVFEQEKSNRDLQLFVHYSNMRTHAWKAVSTLRLAFKLGIAESSDQFCKSRRASDDIIEIRPRHVSPIRARAFVASLVPLVILLDARSLASFSTKDVGRIGEMLRFVAESARRSVVRDFRNDSRVFHLLSLELFRDSEDALRLSRVIPYPTDATADELITFVNASIAMKVWSRGGSRFSKVRYRVSSDVRVVIDERQDDRSASQLTRFCSFDNTLEKYLPLKIRKRIQARCPESQTQFGSSASCTDLGWFQATLPPGTRRTQASKGRDVTSDVCASSYVIKPEALVRSKVFGVVEPIRHCSGFVSWSEADKFCRSAGARLCTLDELTQQQLTAGTGCDGDKSRVWTRTICNDSPLSFLTGPGQSLSDPRSFPIKCVPAKDSLFPPAMARCCADEARPSCFPRDDDRLRNTSAAILDLVPENCTMPIQGSRLACAELRLSYPEPQAYLINQAGYRVCGKLLSRDLDKAASAEMDALPASLGLSTSLILKLPFSRSRALCEARGARLCTSNEILIGGPVWKEDWTRSNKAGLAWTSDDCALGMVLTVAPGMDAKCINPGDPLQVNIVACCGDEFGPYCLSQ